MTSVLNNCTTWHVTELLGSVRGLTEETSMMALNGDDNRDLATRVELVHEIPQWLTLLVPDGIELGLRNTIAVVHDMVRVHYVSVSNTRDAASSTQKPSGLLQSSYLTSTV